MRLNVLAEELGLGPNATEDDVVDKLIRERRKREKERKDLQDRVAALEEQKATSDTTVHMRESRERPNAFERAYEGASRPPVTVTTASKQLIDLAQRCMAERKVNYIKAVEIVGKEHPALYQEWLVESYTEAGQQRAAQIQAAETANQGGFPNRQARQVRPVAGERLMQAIDLVMRDRNITHEAASRIVCDERPDLYDAYRRETYGSGTPIPGLPMVPGEEIV